MDSMLVVGASLAVVALVVLVFASRRPGGRGGDGGTWSDGASGGGCDSGSDGGGCDGGGGGD
jgi:hypothetical protein